MFQTDRLSSFYFNKAAMLKIINTKKQPLRGVPKNRCSFFPGDIHIDLNPRTVLEQVYFPGDQQSW